MARVSNPKRRSGGSRYKKRSTVQRRRRRWIKGGGITTLRQASRAYGVSRLIRGVPNVFPYTRLVKHKYVENIQLPAATGGGFSRQYIFSANGIFDPNISGTGHQPLFHDEMEKLYKYYVVIASFAKLTFDNNDTTQQMYGCICSQDQSFSSNTQTLVEQYGYRKMSTNSQRNYPLVIKGSYDAKKKQNVTLKQLISDSDQLTDPGANPGGKQQFYYTFWTAPFNSGTTLAAQNAFIEITYVTMWVQPQDAIGS